jgi:hypothetical protein
VGFNRMQGAIFQHNVYCHLFCSVRDCHQTLPEREVTILQPSNLWLLSILAVHF